MKFYILYDAVNNLYWSGRYWIKNCNNVKTYYLLANARAQRSKFRIKNTYSELKILELQAEIVGEH